MTNKRKPIAFPELDEAPPQIEPKGRRAILRSVEEIEAEQQPRQHQNASKPAIQNTSITEYQHAVNPVLQNTGMPENRDTRDTEIQDASEPENQNAGIPESIEAGNRLWYTKVTYRLSPEAIDAIEEAKRVLRRTYKLKVSLEEIAEQAIISACNEVLENQHSSILVNKLSVIAESKKARKAPQV